MKKKLLTAIAAVFLLTASVAYSNGFTGSGLSLGKVEDMLIGYFKLSSTNTATGLNTFANVTQFVGPVLSANDIESDITGTVANNQRRGYHVTHNEAGSVCLGPSDGVNKSFCLSNQGGLFKLEGQLGVLYGTATAASLGIAFDNTSNGRVSITPNGVTSIGAGVTTASDTALTVGSNTRTTATFLVDATNDWIKLLPISAPAASECDAATEKGRIYYDSGTDKVRFCNGTAWTDL